MAAVIGTFTGTGQSASFQPKMREMGWGQFNVTLYGTFVATVKIQRSFDAGANWVDATTDGAGTAASYTGAGAGASYSVVVSEPEVGAIYRVNCTAYTSGTVNYRLSQ